MEPLRGQAIFSACERYRYVLSRSWDNGRHCVFVGLNPSTASASCDDATTRKCLTLAKTWGFSGIRLVNLFARKSRYPQALATTHDPVGPDNDNWIKSAITDTDTVVAMWGNHGQRLYGQSLRRDLQVLALTSTWQCMGYTKFGAPRHPLYLASTTTLQPFRAPKAL